MPQSVVVKSWHRILGSEFLYGLPELSQPLLGALVLANVLLKCLHGLIHGLIQDNTDKKSIVNSNHLQTPPSKTGGGDFAIGPFA